MRVFFLLSMEYLSANENKELEKVRRAGNKGGGWAEVLSRWRGKLARSR